MQRMFFRKGRIVGLGMVTSEDAAFCTRYMNDPDVTQYLIQRLPIALDSERAWIESLSKKVMTDQVFGISLIESGELIGMMGLHGIDWIHRTATTGAWIGADEHRGKGYGSEAKLLLLEYAFRTLGLRKITSSVLKTNARSQQYNKKCGYRVEGIRRKHIYSNGVYVDEVLMAVFHKDFTPLWKEYQNAPQ